MKATTRKVRSKFALVFSVMIACHAIASITCQELKQEEEEEEEDRGEEHDKRAIISTSTTNQHLNINNQQETIKVGNQKTNNYHFQASNYQPVQHTQVVFNVNKWKDKKKLRSSRPPTIEEYAVKQRILDVYDGALKEISHELGGHHKLKSPYLQHLGRILQALNPKYIATQRVWQVAFDDPLHPERAHEVVPPESELPPPTKDEQSDSEDQLMIFNSPVELRADPQGQTARIQEQLDTVGDRFKRFVKWDRAFAQQLFKVPDENFTPTQLAYKRLFQCLDQPSYCRSPRPVLEKPNKGQPYEDVVHRLLDGEDLMVQHGSNVEPTRVLPPPDFKPQPTLPTRNRPRVGELDKQVLARSPQHQVDAKVGPSHTRHSTSQGQPYYPQYQARKRPLHSLSRNQQPSVVPVRPSSQRFENPTPHYLTNTWKGGRATNSYGHY